MFKNYFTSAIRSLKRYRLFTLLNIFGLATGMACSILIFLWVRDELSYDKFNTKANQIYRITDNVAGAKAAVTPLPVSPAIKQQIPGVKNAVRLVSLHSIVTIGLQKFDEKNMFYTDPEFLQMFDYPLLQGDKSNVLSRPDGAVITETIARKYFGSVDVIGKTMSISDDVKDHIYTVTGVLKDIPHNSHLQFGVLLPLTVYMHSSNYNINDPFQWGNFDGYSYIQMDDQFKGNPAGISNIESQIDAIHTKNDPSHTKTTFTLQPLTAIHLQPHLLLDVDTQGSSENVTIFSLVAAFILLIACINFMNLSTALGGQRAKEVGLRKTIGAMRSQLIFQFLGESLLVATISLVIGVAIAWLLLPLFNNLSSKTISVNLLNINIIGGLLGTAVLVGLLSGVYSAFFLSSFKPVKVLKGIKVLGGQKSYLRNGLVVLQFAISVVLMVSTLVVNYQVKYIKGRDIGFNKENLLYLQMPQTGDLQNNFQAMKATLSQNAHVGGYTFVEHLPTYLTTGTTDVKWVGKDPTDQSVFPHIGVDGNFIKTFGMHILAGRAFNDNYSPDGKNYIINETAAKKMGMTTETALGQKITMNGNDGQIIGVVRDFNFKPVQQTIEPLILRYTHRGGFVVIRTTEGNIQPVIAGLKKSFQEVYPNFPFSYGFVDRDLAQLYLSEQRMEKLFNIFSVVSIIVSCLGLFGLATFATQKRIKEIGVRRVLGASTAGIVSMLATDFVKLVVVALLIAFPVASWAMDKWLQNYVYRIQLSWWMFAIAGGMAVVIAFLTISYQSIKAALSNPVESLRSE